MAITDSDLALFRQRVLAAKRPLIFHDDDADGLCSFLLCFRARGSTGTGVRVHGSAYVTAEYARKVEENLPDLIVILDKPQVDPEFFMQVTNVPIIWLDHHEPQKNIPANVTYLNPRIENDKDNRCTTHWVYHALGRSEDLWIAGVGTMSDWQLTDVGESFMRAYPHILSSAKSAPDALFGPEPFSTLVRVFLFNLKGDSADVRTAIKILSRVETPDELLAHTTPRAKLVWKRFLMIEREYEKLLKSARASHSDAKLMYHLYPALEISLLSEVSNQLIHDFPDKIVFVAREHNGSFKFSIRSTDVDIAIAVKHALADSGARGNTGGHTNACGGNIHSDDFPKFFEAFRKELNV